MTPLTGPTALKFDAEVMRYYRSAAVLRWPIVACVGAFLGVHVTLIGRNVPWVFVAVALPTVAIAALIWATVGGRAWAKWMPTGARLDTLLQVIGVNAAGRGATTARRARTGAALFLLMCFIPFAGTFVFAAGVMFLTLVIHLSMRNREQQAFTVVGSMLLVCGVMVSAGGFVGGAIGGWIIGLAQAFVLLDCLVALLNLGHFFHRPEVGLGVDLVLVMLGLVAPPVALLFGTLAGLCTVAVLVTLVPALLLAVAWRRLGLAKSAVTKAFHDIGRDTLGVSEADGSRLEDEIRESDGYYRILSPKYHHLHPQSSGASGYIAWLSRVAGDDSLSRLSDNLLTVRSTCLPTGMFETRDVCGERLLRFAVGCLPDFSETPAMGQLREEILKKRNVVGKVEPGGGDVWLIKAPWEHPHVWVFPESWSSEGRSWLYPAGLSLYDAHGLPCAVNGIKVTIKLDRPPPNASVAERIAWHRLLLWNGQRILPGCYESLLMSLMELLPEYSVAGTDLYLDARSVPKNGDAPKQDRVLSDLKNQLAVDWPSRLPWPLGELVKVTIEDLQVDTYVLNGFRAEVANIIESIRTASGRLHSDENAYVMGMQYLVNAACQNGIAPLTAAKVTIETAINDLGENIHVAAGAMTGRPPALAVAAAAQIEIEKKRLLAAYNETYRTFTERLPKLRDQIADGTAPVAAG